MGSVEFARAVTKDIRVIVDSDSVTVVHSLKKRFLRLSLLLHPVPCALL
ncbi:hypothetical protein E1A91_D06G077400v1 [Gossypium mustelinum]|uniref:Uncharacterized protein n=4 Tax=Gossypium TaxID=3633 RepID=A0A5J5R2B2_GOSBA|nr:hypothetical protein ES319_D06G075500v1 [Gossypium barbadense]TYG64087.1 hypothetical protein ES288_D06G081100v1 [Gossypium darwinii]TYH65845.1 hypothetical protein ES332_D06G083100v1 [Gossypium tomentosum]TYI76452.1 hypothetical protein E1A91_D06G077400v1 [Gossypium mustelinum]